MDLKDFNLAPLFAFDKEWALLTAGNEEGYNTMTISWGNLGTLWNKPVATVYVKPVRYTYEWMEKNEYFTISFFDSKYKKDLAVLGSRSGRDGDKVALTGLTPCCSAKNVSFEEAVLTIFCKKIYSQDLNVENMPDFAVENYYKTEAPHRMYVGEVLNIVDKRK